MGKKEPQCVFGQVIREFRKQRGISQEELAEDAGLHRTYISLLERGLRNPSLTVIQQLASALKVKMADLIAESEARLQGRSV